MSHKRVKAIVADDDLYDDYDDDFEEEETGPTTEEQEKLRLGTVEVRKTIGSDFTDEEIQKSLWDTWYDVERTVTYFKNKRNPPAKKTRKAQGQAESVLGKISSNDKLCTTLTAEVVHCATPFTAKEFFRDCPWLRIPADREAEILIEPLYPRLGLLGGSSSAGDGGKMSKLAALAAKRRQKENEKIGSPASPARETAASDTDAYKTSLDRLRGQTYAVSTPKEPKSRIALNTRDKPVPQGAPTAMKPFPPSMSHPEPSTLSDVLIPATERSSATDKLPAKVESFDPQLHPHENRLGESPSQSLQAVPSSFAKVLIQDNEEDIQLTRGAVPNLDWNLYVNGLDENRTDIFDFSGPSPDDFVLNAQKASKLGKVSAERPGPDRAKADLAAGVRDLSLSDAKPVQIPQSKDLDVIAEYKKAKRKNAANFVVIGHVDAGKSTLMGRLLFDLKAIDQRTIDKYRAEAERIGKGSFAFAWVLDSGSEERARGVTIDIAANRFETERTNFTILDAPGHKDFVPNMIAGASQADFAVLVIDASTGSFESGMKGQTKEHALLVRSMGVQKLIVAINKMDSVAWAQGRFDEVSQQMSGFLSTAGFDPAKVSYIPCSGLQGQNILKPPTTKQASWYSGSTLVEALDTAETTTRALEKPLRMIIDDVFQSSVNNPHSLAGRIDAGTLQVGDQIQVMPANITATLKSIAVDDDSSDWAVAGQNVVLNLTSVSDDDAEQIHSGSVLCSPGTLLSNITTFTAKVLAFDHLLPMPVDVIRGRLQAAGAIKALVGTLDKATGTIVKKKPKIVQPGAVARVTVELRAPVPLEKGDRIVLRSGGDTMGTGLVE